MRLKLFIGILVTLFLSSCFTLHKGGFSNSTTLHTNNFRYVQKNVAGFSSTSYFLGFGGGLGMSGGLIRNAKNDLYSKIILKDNQALANVNVDFKTAFFLNGIFIGIECVYSADIVEFISPDQLDNPSNSYENREVRIDSPTTKGLLFITTSTENIYLHPSLKDSSDFKGVNFDEALTVLQEDENFNNYTAPSIYLLKYLYRNQNLENIIPTGWYWSKEPKGTQGIVCVNITNGKTKVLSRNEKAYLLPVLIEEK